MFQLRHQSRGRLHGRVLPFLFFLLGEGKEEMRTRVKIWGIGLGGDRVEIEVLVVLGRRRKTTYICIFICR